MAVTAGYCPGQLSTTSAIGTDNCENPLWSSPRAMRKGAIIFGSVAGAIALGIIVVFYATSGAVETADSFFRAAAAGDMQKAKGFLAEGFTAETSDEELVAFLESSGLIDYREADWGGRSVDTSTGKLTGKVITSSGRTVPLTLTFVREGGDWKIYYIQRESSGLDLSAAQQVALPSREEAAALVNATTAEFAAAVSAGDFAEMHGSASGEFQAQVSLDQFEESFSEFVSQAIDLTILRDYEPMFTSDPALSAQNILRVEGYYPTEPSRAHFTYTYVHNGTAWKLLGIDFNIRPIER